MSALPLGREEGQELELLPAEAVDDRTRIARSVVAMLNAQPGEVWIGVGKEEGRAVRVEPLPEGQAAKRLEADLRDLIEPRPTEHEFAVEAVAGGIRIAVGEARQRPYAFVDRESREYLTREGALLRALTRSELAAAFRAAAPDSIATSSGAAEGLRARREDARARREPALWLRLEPGTALDLDLQDPNLEKLLAEPELSGNRPEGWHVMDPYRRPRLHADHLEIGDDEGVEGRVERGGALELRVALERLRWKGGPRELWPPTLAEYPVSTVRLAARIWEVLGLSADEHPLGDLALIQALGYRLNPRQPDRWGAGRAKTWEESGDLVWERPLETSFAEVRENPDRFGIRLVARIYEAFGFRRDELPHHLRGDRLAFPAR